MVGKIVDRDTDSERNDNKTSFGNTHKSKNLYTQSRVLSTSLSMHSEHP